jgi:cytidylate kinase
MGYRAIALSQVDGAGGESIGRGLAQQLGFSYLNEAIVVQVARDHGVDTGAVAEAERRKSFFIRVAEMAARGGVEVAPDPSLYVDETDTVLSLIRDTLRDAAGRGSVVLVAHGACYACADRSDVLRVGVTAPLSARVSRVASASGITDKEAAKRLRRSDAGRASYLKRVYNVSRESPTDYDVVLNTERLAPDAAVGIILRLVQPRPAAPPSPTPPVRASGG